MVEQLGLAIILVDEKLIKASGFTSGMTNGIFSWYLNWEVLSITIAPALAATGANCSDTDAPAEKKAKSTPVKSKSFNTWIPIFSPLNRTCLFLDLSLAMGIKDELGNSLSSSNEISDSPTRPVAPTIATLY